VDECHHICARAFSRALFSIGAPKPSVGKRGPGEAGAREASSGTGADVCMLGLSATPHRRDGLTECLFWFFGPLAFSASRPVSQMQGVQVHWRCFSSGARIPRTSFAEEVNTLAASPSRNALICDEVKRAWSAGRKVLLLSDRREHLQVLKALICSPTTASCARPSRAAAARPARRRVRRASSSNNSSSSDEEENDDSPSCASPAAPMRSVPSTSVGFYVGGVKGADLEVAGRCGIILATYGMCSEGLDIPSLNTLILATPRATITQSVGRIMRGQEGEGAGFTPLVVDIVDVETSARLDRLAKSRWQEYKSAGFSMTRCAAAVGTCDDADIFSSGEEQGGGTAVAGREAWEEEEVGKGDGEAARSCHAFAKTNGVGRGRGRGGGRVGNGVASVTEGESCVLCEFGAYGGREQRRDMAVCNTWACAALEAELRDEETNGRRQRSEALGEEPWCSGGRRNALLRGKLGRRGALAGGGRRVKPGEGREEEENWSDSSAQESFSALVDLAMLGYRGGGGGDGGGGGVGGVGGARGGGRREGGGGGNCGNAGAMQRARGEESAAIRTTRAAETLKVAREHKAPKAKKAKAAQKPKTAYMRFFAAKHAEVMEKFPGIKGSEVMKMLGSKWKKPSAEDKAVRCSVCWCRESVCLWRI
jgi:DNA polymerase IIIc chi subunit